MLLKTEYLQTITLLLQGFSRVRVQGGASGGPPGGVARLSRLIESIRNRWVASVAAGPEQVEVVPDTFPPAWQ